MLNCAVIISNRSNTDEVGVSGEMVALHCDNGPQTKWNHLYFDRAQICCNYSCAIQESSFYRSLCPHCEFVAEMVVLQLFSIMLRLFSRLSTPFPRHTRNPEMLPKDTRSSIVNFCAQIVTFDCASTVLQLSSINFLQPCWSRSRNIVGGASAMMASRL